MVFFLLSFTLQVLWKNTSTKQSVVFVLNLYKTMPSVRSDESYNARGNILISKFHKVMFSKEDKSQLFQANANMYYAQLWSNYKVSNYKQMTVPYNNEFKYLHSVKGPVSNTLQ